MSRSRSWPILTALSVFIGLSLMLVWLIIRINRGVFTYALDDAYIHMAIAKNFAVHGVWGVTPYHFSSSSSSLLWTSLLALLYKLFGVGVWQPLFLNLLAGALLLVGVDWILQREEVGASIRVLALLAILFFMSMPTLSLTGQEHILHTLISVLFLYLSADRLARDSGRSTWPGAALLLLAALLTAARYEGMFLVFSVGLIYAARRKWLPAALLGVASLLPIAIYGLISLSKGWYFFPNSVLLKGKTLELNNFRAIVKSTLLFVQNLDQTSYLLILIIAASAFIYFSVTKRAATADGIAQRWRVIRYMSIAFILTTLLQTQFAVVGPMTLYRYDAYLVASGIVIAALGFSALDIKWRWQEWASSLTLLTVAVFVLLPFLERGGHALLNTPLAARNIYEQQYQMGQFARMFYRGQGVAANDIGAINFYGDIRGFDLWGLATLEVAQARRNHAYNTDAIDRMTRERDVKIAIVYDAWFTKYGGLPDGWIKAGEWTQPENVLSGINTVSIYAVYPDEIDALVSHLQDYAPHLPPAIKQTGMYVK